MASITNLFITPETSPIAHGLQLEVEIQAL